MRVYVIKQQPNFYIIIGGYKANQKADIAKIDRLVADLKLNK